MKNVFKAKTALMLMMVAVALVGCGKSKNDGGGVVVAPVAPTYPVGGSGGCVAVNYGSSMVLSFQGTLQQGSGIRAQMGVYSTGAVVPSGGPYWRQTYYGDRTDMSVSNSTVTATVQASQSAIALAAQQGGQICGFEANVSYSAAGYGSPNQSAYWGTLGGGTFALVTSNGYRIQM